MKCVHTSDVFTYSSLSTLLHAITQSAHTEWILETLLIGEALIKQQWFWPFNIISSETVYLNNVACSNWIILLALSCPVETSYSPSRILRLCDRWIYRKIKQTPQFSQKLTNFRNCSRFSTDFGIRRVPWCHRNTHSVKERLFLSLKNGMNSLAFSSCQIYKSYIGQTNRKQNESTLLVWATRQTVYLLGPEPRAALDHATLLYTALGDTVKVVEFIAESITSLSNLVRSIQIRRRILLKKRISEQTPLKALFNKHKSPPFTMDLTTTWTTCGRNGLMFSSVFKCFTQLFPALQSFKYYQIWTLFLMCWHYLFILHRLPPFIKLKVS